MSAAEASSSSSSSSSSTPQPLPLRARPPRGGPPKSLENLTTHSTLEDLDCAVRIAFGIKENVGLAYLAGFPPKPLTSGEEEEDDDNEEAPLLGSKLVPNDMVTVREDDGTAPTVIQGTGAMKVGRKKKKAKGAPAAAGSSNIHSLPSSSPSTKRGSSAGGGKAPKRRRVNATVGSEEDVGALLLNAIGGGGGRVGQCMRAVFRKSVEEQYNTAKAEGRLAAASSGQFQIIESAQARRLVDGAAARIEVEFTDIFRKKHRDDVELFQRAVLIGVIMQVVQDEGAREMLRPRNMAGCSPRIFWSLVHLQGPGDVADHLRQLLPNEDWSFLTHRHRELSEKALENKRQEEEAKREREARALERKQEREARLAKKREKEESKRKKEAEVVEVVDKGDSALDEDHDYPEAVSDEWVEVLRAQPLGLRMARDMAAQDGEELAGRVQEVVKTRGLAMTPPTVEEVTSWVNECQSQVLEGLMRGVLGEDDEDLLDDLETARMGTPKDMVLWSGTPSLMINVIKDEVGVERWEEVSGRIDEAAVQEWCDKCKTLLEEMPWLDNWTTGV